MNHGRCKAKTAPRVKRPAERRYGAHMARTSDDPLEADMLSTIHACAREGMMFLGLPDDTTPAAAIGAIDQVKHTHRMVLSHGYLHYLKASLL